MAKISAAIRPIFWAMASCFPIGWPHCTRSAAHRRAISSARLAPATAEAALPLRFTAWGARWRT